MKNELINLWLNGDRNYRLGVEIYNRFGANDFLKVILAEGEDDYNRERLIEELKELLKETDIASEILPKPHRIDYDAVKASELINAPYEIKEAIVERKRLYFEGRDAHSQLKALRNMPGEDMAERRKQLAKTILQNFDLIKPLWDTTNFYDEFGRLPEPKPKEEKEVSSSYALMDNMQLNELWLKQYKYCQKWKTEKTKISQVRERIESNQKIQNVLGDAFQYRKYQMPTIADA